MTKKKSADVDSNPFDMSYKTLSMTYKNTKGEVKERVVRVTRVDEVYFAGFCHTAKTTRTFKFDGVVGDLKDAETGELWNAEKLRAHYGFDPEEKERQTKAKSDKDYATVYMHEAASEYVVSEFKYANDWLRAERLRSESLVMTVMVGDAMAPTINDGDCVLVNMASKRGDGLFLIRLGDEYKIQRLQWFKDGRLKLVSDNAGYLEKVLEKQELAPSEFEVVGACFARQGRLV